MKNDVWEVVMRSEGNHVVTLNGYKKLSLVWMEVSKV